MTSWGHCVQLHYNTAFHRGGGGMNTDDCSKMSFPNNTEKTFQPTHPVFFLTFLVKA